MTAEQPSRSRVRRLAAQKGGPQPDFSQPTVPASREGEWTIQGPFSLGWVLVGTGGDELPFVCINQEQAERARDYLNAIEADLRRERELLEAAEAEVTGLRQWRQAMAVEVTRLRAERDALAQWRRDLTDVRHGEGMIYHVPGILRGPAGTPHRLGAACPECDWCAANPAPEAKPKRPAE